MGFVEARGIELRLVPEMVIDRGDVNSGPLGDLPDGGGVKTEFGENLPGGFDQAPAGVGFDHGGSDVLVQW